MSIRDADLQHQNPTSLAYKIQKEPSSVGSGPSFPHALAQRATVFEHDRAFDRGGSPFEEHAPQARSPHDSLLEEYLRGCRGRGTFTDVDGGSILDESDLDWTKERFERVSIRDDYDLDMADQ